MKTIRILFLISYIVLGGCVMVLMSTSAINTFIVMIAFIGWMLGVIALIMREYV